MSTDPLHEALAVSRRTAAEFGELVDTLRHRKLLLDPRTLGPAPKTKGPVEAEDDDHEPLPPTLTPSDVANLWRTKGRQWLRSIGRRDLSAVIAATAHAEVGPTFASSIGFIEEILPRLRMRRRAIVIGRLYFQAYPPSEHILGALNLLRGEMAQEDWPPWWRLVGHGHEYVARRFAESVLSGNWTRTFAEMQVPDTVNLPSWASAILLAARPTSVAAAEHMVRFCDGGRELTAPAAVSDSIVTAAKAIVRLGQREQYMRLQLASLLRRRIGDVFSEADRASWRKLEPERTIVRQWVSTELLTILFTHLVPTNDGAHQTEPRRHFWTRYTGKVERLWLLIDSRLRARLDRPVIRDLLERVGDLVEIRELEGQDEQAILWMHLRSTSNGIVSVVEGNANSACRIRLGAHEPPKNASRGRKGPVNYSSDIVHGIFDTTRTHTKSRGHRGAWQDKLAADLRSFSVSP